MYTSIYAVLDVIRLNTNMNNTMDVTGDADKRTLMDDGGCILVQLSA